MIILVFLYEACVGLLRFHCGVCVGWSWFIAEFIYHVAVPVFLCGVCISCCNSDVSLRSLYTNL